MKTIQHPILVASFVGVAIPAGAVSARAHVDGHTRLGGSASEVFEEASSHTPDRSSRAWSMSIQT